MPLLHYITNSQYFKVNLFANSGIICYNYYVGVFRHESIPERRNITIIRKGRDLLKKKLLDKAVSLIAAAALSCTSVIGSVSAFASYEGGAPGSAKVADAPENSELVTVIVKVSGDAVLTTPEGAEQGSEFLITDEAVQMSEALENTQSRVQNEIRKLYPEMQVGYSYSVLYNGFSCEIPEYLIDAVKALPYVVDVAKCTGYYVPQMAAAPSLSNIPSYYDATGCYGEGKVVAVIDSELDYTHPMFAALDEDIETALTLEDIAEIAGGIGFNVDVDPTRAYLSSKLPYVIDYVDDPYDGVWDDDIFSYHGTHVSGIAAGNEFTDEEGKTISGIAKNAQLVFMAVGMGEGNIDTDAAIAAIEDAVKLHADVINMSFVGMGECYDDPVAEVYAAVENAGVVICNSSGNYAEGSVLGSTNFASNPDVGTSNNVPAGTKIFTVASAGNPHTESYCAFIVDGELMKYTETYRSDSFEPFYMGDELQGEYEYVFCGTGTEEDFDGLDLTGKIALVKRGELFLEEKAVFAQNAGAVGIICFANEGETVTPGYVDSELPSAIISYEDAQKMLETENKTLLFTDETIDVDIPTSVSDFTSWGVKHCLELEPDIMGIGGYVESAAYGDSTAILDGTSMSSPYVAGCVAVMLEYMDKQGIQLEGDEKISYVRDLMMNSATLYTDEDGLYVSPRRQGAGLVNMNAVLSDKVIMTNDLNDAKINLYDNIGDTFDFDVNLTNLSDEDVEFSSARLVLTTNDHYFDDFWEEYCVSPTKQIALESSADVSALMSISAGESRTEHVSVSLDPFQTASISEFYTNGFFVEGYLILEGAENCCDISVPILGFYGDWAQLPIFDTYTPGVFGMGSTSVAGGFSMAERAKVYGEIMAQIPEDELNDESADLYELINTYATEEQQTKLWERDSIICISPNGDGLADVFGINANNVRYARCTGLNVYNEDGELVFEGEKFDTPLKDMFITFEVIGDLSSLPDGIYTAEISSVIDYAASYENPQKIVQQFIIDKKAPELKTEIVEENGRRILRLTAADDDLDGIYVSGTGNGGIYGVYDPENPTESGIDALLNSVTVREFSEEGSGFTYFDYDTSSLPVIGKLFTESFTDADLADLDFSEIIVAEPDENGEFTVEYDITDLSAYSFTVMDKAYNFSEYASEAVIAEGVRPGIYTDNQRVYSFTENTVSTALFKNGETSVSEYSFEDGMAFINGEPVTVYQINSRIIKLVGEDGASVTLVYQGEGTLEDYHFYTTDQIEQALLSMASMMLPNFNVTRADMTLNNNQITAVIYVEIDGEEYPVFSYCIDNTTGEGYDINFGEEMSLFPVTIDDIASDVWMEVKDGEIDYWDFDNSVTVSQEDKLDRPFSYTLNNTEVTFDFNGVTETATLAVYGETYAMAAWEDGTVSYLYYVSPADGFAFYGNHELRAMAEELYIKEKGKEPEMLEMSADETGNIMIRLSETEYYLVSPITGDGMNEDEEYISLVPVPELPEGAYTLEELNDMALNDYEQKTGIRPEVARAEIIDENTVVISLGEYVDDEFEVYDYYIVDPVTGEGYSSDGEEVDLPQTGNNSPVTAAMVSVSVLMIAAGAFTVLRSGVLRRKSAEE